jgi:hypothetical protein
MSLFVEVVLITIYGGSAIVAAGAGLAWATSRRFRHSLVGDQEAR